ncbi:ankyrin repeat domain-containing protein [Paenibacillus sp. 23TSA30-6]|uniref:ankyrin repeat domain-containing protein n=1 Tax=Paenibacillus sp. 23TSA30-6 TaxID=2546104 RepID=UPI0017880E54|nr:ankyrin repeat domain-containing protein [Paenibacillus sp. 23TSA30-6]MBE0336034.1 ankyrin repeat domain-containing protein [Paenibacillus sp. 23TSA30-6]
MTKINRLVILVLALSITGCNTAHVTSSAPTSTPASADTVSDTNEILKGITISDYFPKDTTYTRTYHSMIGTNGKALYSTTEYTEFIGSNEDSEKYIIHMSDTEISSHKASGKHAIEYTVSKNLIQRNHGIFLSNEREWKNQDSVFQITGTGINMSTKAGSFSNCIEVTEQVYSEGKVFGAKKSYYAPNVGLIFSKMKADSDNYVPYEELVSNTNSQPVPNKSSKEISTNIQPGYQIQNSPAKSAPPSEDEAESSQNPPLINAAITGDVSIIQSLLAQGDDPNGTNVLNITPLMEAARNGHLQAVQTLLNAHADINLPAANGETALMWAVDGGFKDIVDMLLQHGANPDVQGEFYRTALMSAAKNGFTDIVAALLKAHADPTLQDDSEDGKHTALQYAVQAGHKDIVKLLKNAKDKK